MTTVVKYAVALCLWASLALAQVPSSIYCKLSLENTITAKAQYGGKLTFFTGATECKNYSSAPSVPFSGVDIDLSLTNTDTVPPGDAGALITKTFNGQPGQQWSRDLTAATGALGFSMGLKAVTISAATGGWIMGGVAVLTQYVIPLFTANEPPVDLTNQCGNLQPMMMPANGTITCKIYVLKPAKGVAPLPGVVNFSILTAPPSVLPPMPPIPPVTLPWKFSTPPRGAITVPMPLPDAAPPLVAPFDDVLPIPVQAVSFLPPSPRGTFLQVAATQDPAPLRKRLDSYGFPTATEPAPDGSQRVLVGPVESVAGMRAALDGMGFNGSGAIVRKEPWDAGKQPWIVASTAPGITASTGPSKEGR